MQRNHWIGMIVVLVVGYLIGVSYPAWGTSAVAKVKGLV